MLLTSILLKLKDKPALFSVLDNNPKDSIKWLWLKTCEKLSPWSESSLLIVELCKEWNPARRHMTHTHCHHQQPALVPSISFYWNHIWFSFRKIRWRYQLSIIQVLREASHLQNGWIFGKFPKGRGGGHFQSKNLYCRFLPLFIDDTSVMNFENNLQHNFPKMRGGVKGRLELFRKSIRFGGARLPLR